MGRGRWRGWGWESGGGGEVVCKTSIESPHVRNDHIEMQVIARRAYQDFLKKLGNDHFHYDHSLLSGLDATLLLTHSLSSRTFCVGMKDD